jgi:hypothetical protein
MVGNDDPRSLFSYPSQFGDTSHPFSQIKSNPPTRFGMFFFREKCPSRDKKESVSLVWAIREAECGDWEILTFQVNHGEHVIQQAELQVVVGLGVT